MNSLIEVPTDPSRHDVAFDKDAGLLHAFGQFLFPL
jgi:hypothetical protein